MKPYKIYSISLSDLAPLKTLLSVDPDFFTLVKEGEAEDREGVFEQCGMTANSDISAQCFMRGRHNGMQQLYPYGDCERDFVIDASCLYFLEMEK